MAISERSVVDATLLAVDEINDRAGVIGRQISPHDTEVPPPDMIARKNVLLKYQPLRLTDFVAWAWAGL